MLTYRSMPQMLEEATARFLETGVAWPGPHGSGMVFPRKKASALSEVKARVHLRTLASEKKRPFIYANSEWYDVSGEPIAERLITVLTIPRTKRLHMVMMALFLCANDDPASKYSRYGTDHPVVRWENKTSWMFQFSGEVGHRIFESFMDQCRTDPLFRIAMNNTHRVTPEVVRLAA